MNVSQELIWTDLTNAVIRGRVERLWQPGTYVGSYGDMESAKISAYVRKWEAADEDLCWQDRPTTAPHSGPHPAAPG